MDVFKHPNFRKDIVGTLNNTFLKREGSIFQNEEAQTIIQTTFLADILTEINPKYILETGTHKANFDYFCKLILPDVQMITFGNNQQSAICVDYLNGIFGAYIRFILGDSNKTLSEYSATENIDFAWVDGGHTYQTCMSDLVNCARLGIPHICVDDYNKLVKRPVTDFLSAYNYEMVRVSSDTRGIVYLRWPVV